jgi:hypothetical protein
MSQDLKSIVISEKPELFYQPEGGEKVRILSIEDENYLDSKYDSTIKFMVENHSQDYDDLKKDDLYQNLKDMWNEVSGKEGGKMNDISFSLVLNKQEHKYLLDLLRLKIEYDVDTIFYGLELENLIESMNGGDKYENDIECKAFDMTAVDIHYLYHVLKTHKVNGINKASRTFASIIRKIALSSNVYNYYKQKFENLSKAIQMWVASLEPNFAISGIDPIYKMIWGDVEESERPIFKKEEVKEEVK